MIEYADVIVDLQHGDTGKGKVASFLVENGTYTHVIRYNGSNNAGHTVFKDGRKFVTHAIPVGVLHGVKSIIGPGCVVNVDHFFNELRELGLSPKEVHSLVKVAKNTHVITKEHLEEDGNDKAIGTTKRGNGPAYRDKYDRKGVRAEAFPTMEPYLVDMYEELHGNNEPCRILFEGAQGFYLDVDWGDYPYVTSSHCTVGSAVMNGVPPQKIRKVFGVAKIYETYVGAKKFEGDDVLMSRLRTLGQEYGATTGRARLCNWLNIDNLNKATRINGVTDIIINKFDILKEIGVWKAYTGGKLEEFANEKEFLIHIVKTLPDVRVHLSDNPNDMGNRIW